jgi:uncharacterized protein YlxW (UPF0749 family)
MTTTMPQLRSFTSLLDHIVAESLDSDYIRVAESRPGIGDQRMRSLRGAVNRPAVVAVLAAFGLLIGVSALLTRKEAPVVDQQRTELARTVARQQALFGQEKQALSQLRRSVSSLRASSASTVRSADRVGSASAGLEVAAGSTAVSGPGVRITLADARGALSPSSQGTIRDSDLQALVNGLWEAGAEAVAINGLRIGPTSAIRFAGEAITVNYRSLLSPYTIIAIGNPDTLPAKFAETQGGQLVLSLRTSFKVPYAITTVHRLFLPATTREHMRYAGADVARSRAGGN